MYMLCSLDLEKPSSQMNVLCILESEKPCRQVYVLCLLEIEKINSLFLLITFCIFDTRKLYVILFSLGKLCVSS